MVNVTTPLLIIGAALPRTATTSLAAALEELGYRVWHATTWSPAMTPIWNDISQAEEQGNQTAYRAAFDQFVEQLSLEGFNATLDQPSCFVYQELMEYYPDAKVLKTERSAPSWARSMIEMAFSLDLFVYQPPYNNSWNKVQGPFGYWAKKKLGFQDEEIYPKGVPFNGTNHLESKSSVSLASCEAAYHRYQQQVVQTVPPEKLVSYSSKQGWEPLCRHFLPAEGNQKCPPLHQEFPRVNSRSDGFLLDFRRTASAKVHLYRIHPILANQEWLVRSIVFTMKRRRALVDFLQTKVFRRR